MEDIIGDIREAAAFYNQYEKVFLCDGDAIAMDTEDLLEIIAEIKKGLPPLSSDLPPMPDRRAP